MATEEDKVNTGALGTIVAVGLFATLSIALAVTALVRYSVQGVIDERQSLAQEEYHDLRSSQNGKLSAGPAWSDKGKGLVSIPIERAKARVLAEIERDPTRATPPAPSSAFPAGSAPAGMPSAAPAPTTASAPAPKPTDG